MRNLYFLLFIPVFLFAVKGNTQHSVARDWNEQLLEAIRKDFARPTIHARNLFHSAAIMYDSWAVFNDAAETVFLGKTFGGFTINFDGIATSGNPDAAIHEIMSYAMYRLLNHRFANSPNATTTLASFTALFESYNYDMHFTSTDYSSGSYAALGNYIAEKMIAYGLQDGANEHNGYDNLYYTASNNPLILELYQNNTDIDPDKWQPLAFDLYIDQSGNIYPQNTPEFLSPEWGQVTPFALKNDDLNILNNGFDSYIYNDPGHPVFIQNSIGNGIDDPYKWHFAMVIAWSAHLDPANDTMTDISPGGIGNVAFSSFPTTFSEYKSFYNFTEGGDMGTGHAINPFTNAPYTPQMVKRADYARVLAEFWADGPDSETPPGHWFTLLNYVSDHPETVKKMGGQGAILSDLEWDVKSYLILGGAMHDAAVNTWGVKGYYDYIRPISAIRYMAGKGQSTYANLPSFDPHGLPIIPGIIEIIKPGDPLAGNSGQNLGKIKVMSWKGPDYITDPDEDVAGVDWILGTRWWPYQRPTFVTPPFAGYVSGHSAFSRAAAEVLTLLTGDAFFPGGMGTFDITQNQFLVFEEGPSESFTLQWATYRDASDQTSLSRIWGGIHPPIDDIPGRIIGDKIGKEVFALAEQYFAGTLSIDEVTISDETTIYPIPVNTNILTIQTTYPEEIDIQLFSLTGSMIFSQKRSPQNGQIRIETENMTNGIYILKGVSKGNRVLFRKKLIKS
ncbi:MAG: T9SS type A sorting domain-containing protein [Flavobacteriaceae bacterium]|nr:MAG: T9SS type A sorting domain-containing protein [Flavobacteriaceae bacterium]